MKRILAIWLPNWPIQRRRLDRPELIGRAIILQASSRHGQAVAACSAEAQAAGVRYSMPVTEALALINHFSCPPAPSPRWGGMGRGENHQHASHLELHNPQADRRQLARLAQWCCQFSPTVGLEDADAPETLLLDVTNLAPLYGGEAALVQQVQRACHRRGLDVRLAVADTIGAAWALAHYEMGVPLLPRREGTGEGLATAAAVPPLEAPQRCAVPPLAPPCKGGGFELAPLPLAALRLPPDLLATLADLGLERVGELLALPREQLRSRLGPLVLLRIDQMLGRASEVFFSIDPPPDFAVEHVFEYPIAGAEAIRYTVEQLLKRLAVLLAARSAGALRLRCRLDCEAAPPMAIEFDVFQPTARWRHLLEILDLHLERVRLPAPAVAVALRVLRHAPLVERQNRLFDQERTLGSSRALAGLIDRLAGRLGSEAVVRCALMREVQPELAYREEALTGAPGSLKAGLASADGARPRFSGPGEREMKCLDRPLCLLSRPAPLAVWAMAPDGRPIRFQRMGVEHEITRHWGPERIETGWWRRTSAWRDYYRVETTAGRRFWLFRRRRDGRWFLHGSYE